METVIRDSLVDVDWVHIGEGGEGVTLLVGYPLRRIDATFTLEQAESIMRNATALSARGWGIPVRAYHEKTRATSPLTGLPRCDDGSPPIVGMVTAVGVDDDLNPGSRWGNSPPGQNDWGRWQAVPGNAATHRRSFGSAVELAFHAKKGEILQFHCRPSKPNPGGGE